MAEKILIASGKGGVGKTSCSVGLGTALADEYGQRVLLVDCDIGLRSLDVLLGTGEKIVYDWGDVILGNCLASSAIVPCEKVDLLTCPLKFDNEYDFACTKKMISNYDKAYDYIILDAPAGIDVGFEIASSMADRAIIVSTSDRVCVRSAQRAGEKLFDMGMTDVRLIINRFRKKSVTARKLLNIDSVIDETLLQLIGVVPEDEDITYGKVYSRKSQPSHYPFVRIAGRILGKEIPLELK